MIHAYWWKRLPNFGDALNPLLLERLSGQSVQWSGSATTPTLVAIGSVVQSAKPGWHVWGGGLIAENAPVASGLTIYAVRGPRTRTKLAAQGYPADVPLGDPASLLPMLFPAPAEATYDWGIIPHYIDYPHLCMLSLGRSLRTRFAGRSTVCLINPLSSPADCIRRLKACRRVASSSLHGLIAADAFGIPNVWFATVRNPIKTLCLNTTTFVHDEFKYYDYFDAVGRMAAGPTLISARIPWDEWEAQADQWSPIRWDPGPLLDSFPFKTKEWSSLVRECERHFKQ